MELKLGNSCGSCIHTNRPKKPREHAAHYEVAKTERWCFKHSLHVTRETTCEDHEGVNRSAKTSYTRTKTYNDRRIEVLKVVEKMGDKKITIHNYTYFVLNGWICYTPSWSTEPRGISTKDSSVIRTLNELNEILK